MKKFFSLILVAMLSLSPIYAFATENAQALTPTTSETPTEAAAETPAPEISTEAPAAEAPASEVPAQGSVTDGDSIAETPSSEQLNTDTSTDATSDESSVTKTDDKKTGETADEESTEDENKEETDLEEDSEEELDEESEEDEKDEKDKTSIPEHEHEFEYISNKDGTHIVKCIATVIREKEDGEEGETEEVPCDYELVEECSFDADGVCIYCEYVKPKEEPTFDPIVSLSISNDSCTIGKSNPLICMSIAAEDYDVEYAQICFANYAHNKYINVGLAQGKYFDFKANDFVYTGSSSWYASPDITDDYAQGNYAVRSVYIRSTTGESVHYSVESGNLPEGYQYYSIELAKPTGMSLIRDLFTSESNEETPISEEPVTENIVSEPDESEPVVEEPVVSETTESEPAIEDNATPKPEATVVEPNEETPKANEPTQEQPEVESPKADEPIITESPQVNEPKVEEQPNAEEPKATETPRSTTNSNSATTNNSNNNQNSGSNSILNFFKKLFGLK